MNRKFPRSRPFFTVRGFAFVAVVVLLSLTLGYCAASLFGVIQ